MFLWPGRKAVDMGQTRRKRKKIVFLAWKGQNFPGIIDTWCYSISYTYTDYNRSEYNKASYKKLKKRVHIETWKQHVSEEQSSFKPGHLSFQQPASENIIDTINTFQNMMAAA